VFAFGKLQNFELCILIFDLFHTAKIKLSGFTTFGFHDISYLL